MLTTVKIEKWDDQFFEEFSEFRNSIHKSIPSSFPEFKADYAKYFAATSPFLKDYIWCAFSVREDQQIKAQAILCWKKDSTKANLGFIDWVNNGEVAQKLINEVTSFARNHGLKNIKTPVDVNFFVKYRIRLPSSNSPFYGEPIYPDYYHDLFKNCGLTVIGEWDTYLVDKMAGIRDFFSKRKKLSNKLEEVHNFAKDPKLKTKIRSIRMNDWENELRIIHSLFVQAYQTMPEYESISFEQFKAVYDDFKYIVQPWLSYIIELQGKPVAFSINYADPLPILNKYKNKKISSIGKLWLFLRLRLNMGTFLIAHVGKIPGPNGEDIKGVQIQVSKRIAFFYLFMQRMLVTFQNKESPSRRSWNDKVQIPYAKYVLYGLDL
jgi:hypothetical protein